MLEKKTEERHDRMKKNKRCESIGEKKIFQKKMRGTRLGPGWT